MICPICNIANLVTINMTVNDRNLTLHSCALCETRWWDRDGEHVGLNSVLETARVQRTA
jgi:Zn-finger nucleic acid-binding protein